MTEQEMWDAKVPRLTVKVLRGIATAVAYAEADLEGDDSPDARRDADDVARAGEWVSQVFRYRLAKELNDA
jgi:hypothetical protein